MDEPQKNFSQSIVDDSIKANAEFQFSAGMSPKIIRTSTGKCCEWCERLIGVYDYESVRDTGNAVFRRHQRCRCKVLYDPKDGKGKVQNAHSKKWQRQDVMDVYVERINSANNQEKIEARKTVGLKDAQSEKKRRIEKSKEITSKDLDRMSLKELQELGETTAVDFYKSGLSGISFGNADPERVAKALVKNSSRSSLKKDILSMQKKMAEQVAKTNKLDIIKSGAISGARNPYGNAAEEHAKKYYGLVRSMTTDVDKIAKTTGFSTEDIQGIKNYIFMDKHDLGGAVAEYFKPDYMMGESWRRLMNGVPEKHDLTLIKHEMMERKLVLDGMSQDEAHVITSKVYNYDKEATEFYDQIKKYNKE